MKKAHNIMKKALLLSLGLAFFIGCSPDSQTSSEIESVDLTKIINPDTARAAAEFDNTTNGIYKGVFVSNDLSYHGVLTVNFANDAQYNAVLEYGEDLNQRIGFVRINNGPTATSNVIEFRGSNAGFTLNVSDYTQPVVTEGYIDGQGAQMKLLKETSSNRVNTVLGTFSDSDDAAFNGTWDFMSSGTRIESVPTGRPLPVPPSIDVEVNNISEVVVTKSGGAMYFDTMMEEFTPGSDCQTMLPTLPTGTYVPFYTGAKTITITVPGSGDIFREIDEYGVGSQTSNFAGEEATWSLVYSKEFGNKYYDTDCNELPLGATWSWKGRSGYIVLN